MILSPHPHHLITIALQSSSSPLSHLIICNAHLFAKTLLTSNNLGFLYYQCLNTVCFTGFAQLPVYLTITHFLRIVWPIGLFAVAVLIKP